MSEHTGVFFSDFLEECFVAQNSSANSEEINLIIRSHALHRKELDQLLDTSLVLEENVHLPPKYIEHGVIQNSSGNWVVSRQYN